MKQLVQNIFTILNNNEKKNFLQLAALDIIASVLDIAFLAALLLVINFYTKEHTDFLNGSFTWFNKYPLLPVAVFFIFFCIKNFFGFNVLRMQLHFVYAIASRLSQKKLKNYFDSSYNNYSNINSSVHSCNISQHPIEFAHYVLWGLLQIISQSVLIFITITAILIFNPVLFLLLFIILSPPVILTAFLMKKKLSIIRKKAKTISEKNSQHLKEALSAYVESNLYNKKDFFSNRYHATQSIFNNFLSEQLSLQNMPSRLMEVFAILGLFVLILINSFTGNSNSIELITLGAFMGAAYKIIPGIVKILNSAGQMKTYEFTVNNLLQTGENLVKKESTNNKLHSVEFENFFFKYKNQDVLKNFCFKIKEGDFIGLSGKSGIGKTTSINLLLGFLESGHGNIYFNNEAVSAEKRQQYWKHISYVKQQSFFIHDSVLKNITLSENHFNKKKIEEIIEVTGLSELGIEKLITENGKNISGGQRQRISIARTLYKDADLIILDEPFSELDRASEDALLNHFKKLARNGKMVILITHNKESLSFCDKIISLDEEALALNDA